MVICAKKSLFLRGLATFAIPEQYLGVCTMIEGFDHAAIPMGQVDDMLRFYRGLGTDVREEIPGFLFSAYLGANKINLHLPAAWQSSEFTLRGPTATPGCGDFCFVWKGSEDDLMRLLANVRAEIEEGPVPRRGGRDSMGTSIYVRDPDRNLLEFIRY